MLISRAKLFYRTLFRPWVDWGLNIWRGLLIIFSVCGFYLSAFYLKGLIEIGTLTAVTFPVYLALMALFTGIFILATIYQKYEFD